MKGLCGLVWSGLVLLDLVLLLGLVKDTMNDMELLNLGLSRISNIWSF